MKLVLKNGKRKHTFYLTGEEATILRAITRLAINNGWLIRGFKPDSVIIDEAKQEVVSASI